MKKILVVLIVLVTCNGVYAQQPRTLGGFGAGGLDGNGFGDPVANDYAGIDWGYDFQTGMIINGYDTGKAAAFANRMSGSGSYGIPMSPSSAGGYWQHREAEMDAYFRMRLKNKMYRDREKRYDKYRLSGAWEVMTFEQYEAGMSAASSIYNYITGQ